MRCRADASEKIAVGDPVDEPDQEKDDEGDRENQTRISHFPARADFGFFLRSLRRSVHRGILTQTRGL